MYETFKTIIFSFLIILIFHFILKHLLVQAEYMYDLKNIEKMNNDNYENNNNSLIDNDDNNNNNNNNINLSDMKDELLDFINSNNDGLYNKENTNYLKNYSIENKNEINLNNFFEKKNICEPDPVVDLKTKSGDFDISSNQWNYENENVMNGGAILDGLHGFDNSNDCWAQCDIK